jgi:hypothetical protein
MFTDDFIHGECNGRNMYDYDHDGDDYGPNPTLTSNLIGRIKVDKGRAILFELFGASYSNDEYKIVGEKWLPKSQIKLSPLKNGCNPVPKELEGFVKINTPLWLVNKFRGEFRATIEF